MKQLIQTALAATLVLGATPAFAEENLFDALSWDQSSVEASFARTNERLPGPPGHGPGHGPRPGHPPRPGYPPPPPPRPYPPAPVPPPASGPAYDRVGDCTVEREGYSDRYVIYNRWHQRIDDAWGYREAMERARRADFEGRCSRDSNWGRRTECRIQVRRDVFIGYGRDEWEATSDARSKCLRVYNNSYTCNDPRPVCRYY